MPALTTTRKVYNCGAVKIVRNEKMLSSEEKKKCFGFVEHGICSALNEQLCKTEGKCAFWKEGPVEADCSDT